ncbi:hypothetical protein ARMSODRAFT_952423 [Armillaria solidipes]|uniref:Uncharacterized protein n=1 Tax=Armillaria solidipes TaxID=1076256 RepID=A0A2H3BR66_9AGAR|nr:hypothetical protein ARMSODRAFT_952423 [Armillaria solidipes]
MSFPSVSTWKWSTAHRAQYSSPSSSPPCSSSPPASPHSIYSQCQARVQSSPSPGYCIDIHDPGNGASNWFRRELHPLNFPHPKVPCKLPSFHSMFGDLPPPMSDVEEYSDVADTHLFRSNAPSDVSPSHASVFYTDSEEEDHDPEDEVCVETASRATFFRVSEERGQWKNDPIPFQPQPSYHQRNSMPTSSRPVPPSPDRRLASEPAGFSVNSHRSGHEDLDFTSEFSPESDDRQASYDADVDSELITSESEMPDDDNRPYSPLPPSSPPLSSMSFSVSPMIGPMSPTSVSALPPLSPVIIPPLRSDDTDIEGIHLSVAVDPSSSPLVQTKYEIPPCMIPETSITCGAELDTITAVISTDSPPSPSPEGFFDKDQRPVSPPPAFSVVIDTDVNTNVEDSVVPKEDLSDDVITEHVTISDAPTKQEVPEQDQMVEVTLKEKNGVDYIAAATMGHEKRKKEQDDGPKKKKPRLGSHSTSSGAAGDDENSRTASKSETKSKTKARKPRKQAEPPRRRRRQPSYSSSDEEDEEPAKRQPPPPPPLNFSVEDAELCGMIIESMATSRASSHRASSIYKAVIQNRPALKSQREDPEWIASIRRVLEEAHCVNGMFGKVESSGMDDSNHPLEAQWFYVPERDEDQERASLMRAMMPRPAKRSETKKYKQYYYRPLGKISRWDSEDAL